MIAQTESIRSPEQAKPLRDRKEDTAQNVNFYVARIKAKKINRIYWEDDLQELYQNLHELFYLTKQQISEQHVKYGRMDLIDCVNDWLNLRDVKDDVEYGHKLSLAYLDALITKGVIKP